MKIALAIGLLSATLMAVGITMLIAGAAECAWCPTYTCFGGDCPQGCVCLIPSGEMSGNCISLQ